MFRIRAVMALSICLAVLVAVGGQTKPEQNVSALGTSSPVIYENIQEEKAQQAEVAAQRRAELAAFYAAVKAERARVAAAEEAERLEAARQAEIEEQRRAEAEAAEPPPAPVQAPVAASGGCATNPDAGGCWDALAGCESGGNWAANTGNGYYGGIQFALSSWQGVGGTGYPHEASRETQIEMGRRLWRQGGWAHWPACSSKLGYR